MIEHTEIIHTVLGSHYPTCPSVAACLGWVSFLVPQYYARSLSSKATMHLHALCGGIRLLPYFPYAFYLFVTNIIFKRGYKPGNERVAISLFFAGYICIKICKSLLMPIFHCYFLLHIPIFYCTYLYRTSPLETRPITTSPQMWSITDPLKLLSTSKSHICNTKY